MEYDWIKELFVMLLKLVEWFQDLSILIDSFNWSV